MSRVNLSFSPSLMLHLFITCVIGAGLNSLSAPFYSTGIAAFGMGAAIYGALRFPSRYAIPLTVLISLPLWVGNNGVIGKETLTLLPIVISFLAYEGSIKRVLRVGAGSWTLVFLPILLLEHAVYDSDLPSVMFSGLLVTWVSGAFGLISGHFAYIVGNGIERNIEDPAGKVSFHFLFSYFFAGCFFVASMTVVYLSVSLYQSQQEEQIKGYMKQRVAVLEQQLSDFIRLHKNAIASSAKSLSMPYAQPNFNAAADNQLSLLHTYYPEFLTFLITDSEGEIQHAHPPNLMEIALINNKTNVSYRPYFRIPMEGGELYLSDVFRGTGFGDDPIVAISAPITKENGVSAGIVEGSLSLQSFATIDALNLPGFSLLLEDQKGDVIYASDALGFAPLLKAPEYPCGNKCELDIQNGPNNKPWFRMTTPMSSAKWFLSYYYDKERLYTMMSRYLLTDLGLLFLLSLLGTFTGYCVSRLIELPIRRLINHIANFSPAHDAKLSQLPAKTLHITELALLSDEFLKLERRLTFAFDELEKARVNEKNLNVELAELNKSLEQRIREKTHDLRDALTEAKAASVAKTQFLANMSHEIRTPMNGIIGSCDLLLEHEMSEAAKKRAGVIAHSATNLLMILDSILDWSKIESGKLIKDDYDVCVSAQLEACCSLYEQAAGYKGVDVTVACSARLPAYITTDGGKLSQILNNLVSNAIKFTHQGSVTIHGDYVDNTLLITVSDTGIGIPSHKVSDIFGQFEQADASTTRDFGGTGLGLAITKGLVEFLGGTIRAESELGKGTTFSVTIPCDVSHQAEQTMAPVVNELPQGLKFLVAEDNDINAEIVLSMLKAEQVKAIRVKNGKDAVEAAQKHKFDIILMDCQMPVMDGLSASRAIRNTGNANTATPIIALTANAFVEDRQACLAAGMNAHLTKPINKVLLINCIVAELSRV
ncbi:ATP-binding protein [Alteromonas sp. A079]|uniref:ATP-binding protein n=1 Tax=Alteromonas sp. A079 TaxID=3410268 RepID=UPI003B9FFBDC